MVGQTIAHYRIVEKLGEGGMGVVYKAVDTHLDRFVALKVLPPEKVADAERKRRFVQEAKAASALNHPNIVTVYDIDAAFTPEGPVDFIAMELIAGKTLEEPLRRKALRTGTALQYAVQIADALATAHAAGIIHRDIKPANIMVTERGLVKLLDFGLAKLNEPGESGESAATRTMPACDSPETGEGVIVGTVAYMSPEQAEGKKVDARSDIFSFGALLYEMVTGRRPFQGDSKLSTMAAILNKEPKPVSQVAEGVPLELERLISRCLRKDPERRLQHAADLKVALLDLKEESDSGSQAGTAATARRRMRSPWRWVGASAGVVSLAFAGWFAIARRNSTEASPTVRPLTSHPGSESGGSFSPDGRQVAFAWNGESQDNYDIYVKLVDSEPPLRLTTSPEDDVSPAWSPDGRQIAFCRAGARVMLISPLGGAERKLADLDAASGSLACSLAWSPDGQFLAVRDGSAITLLSLSGEKRKFTSPPAGSWGDVDPAFSPDGQTIAFVRRYTFPSGDIFLAPISDGTKTRRLTHDNRVIRGFTWTADGKDVVFSSDRLGDASLWRITASGGTPQPLPFAGPDALYPGIARQGRRAAFMRYASSSSIWRLELGPGKRTGAPARLIGSTRRDQAPSISPDGQRIAFASDRSGSMEIWACDSGGANPVQLTSLGRGHVGPPSWSPDGSRIVFSARPGGNADVFVIDSRGGPARQLTTEPSDENNPSFSRDGRWIYFGSNRGGRRQIWKMPAAGGTAIQVTQGGGFTGVESADGKYFYYVVTETGSLGTLRRIPTMGGEETAVMPGARNWADWSLADDGVYHLDFNLKAVQRRASLNFFRFDSHKSEQIAALDQLARSFLVRLSLSPDRLWLLFDQFDRSESDLMLVENFQ